MILSKIAMPHDEPIYNKRSSDQGIMGRTMQFADLINRLGMAVFISGSVVVLAIGWIVGWWATPWVTPKDFHESNRIYMQVHDAQNAIHLEQLTESKRQTRILTLTRCDALENIDDRRQCFREAREQ